MPLTACCLPWIVTFCFLAAVSVLHPAGLFANSANALCFMGPGGCFLWPRHSRGCWTLCQRPHAGPRCLPLACQTCRASRCTHMPIHSTASCAWPGASTISLPAPQPPTLDDACSEVRGEVSHIDYKGTDNLRLISSAS